MNFIDIGVNLTNKRFKNDLPEVLERSREQGVSQLIVTGTCLRASREAITLVEQYSDYLKATSGVHPHDADTWNREGIEQLRTLAKHPHVVAVGECGLDFNRNFSTKENQLACFRDQLTLAVELNLPVFLHERDAHEDFLKILKEYRQDLCDAVVHCFTGNTQEVEAYLELDCHIGITGWLCDERRGQDLREAVLNIPAERLMIETDAPFLTPRDIQPKPKNNRNEPALLPHVLNSLAEIIKVSPEDLAKTTYETTRAFFRLKD